MRRHVFRSCDFFFFSFGSFYFKLPSLLLPLLRCWPADGFNHARATEPTAGPSNTCSLASALPTVQWRPLRPRSTGRLN